MTAVQFPFDAAVSAVADPAAGKLVIVPDGTSRENEDGPIVATRVTLGRLAG